MAFADDEFAGMVVRGTPSSVMAVTELSQKPTADGLPGHSKRLTLRRKDRSDSLGRSQSPARHKGVEWTVSLRQLSLPH